MSPKATSHPPDARTPIGAGRLIPVVLTAIAVSILFSGFLPLRWFHFQDYEMARQILQWDAPFIPNFHVRTAYFEGDEAEAGNLPAMERLAMRDFTTDKFGFRYTPPVRPARPADVVVFRGFSFVFGVGLGDNETFPAALARRLDANVYNASRFHEDPETPADFDNLMMRAGMRPKTVVYVHLEANSHALSASTGEPGSRRRLLWFAKEYPLSWIRASPVILTAVEAKKAVENDRILHNRYRENVRSFPLADGSRLLVRKGDLERGQTDFDASVVAARSEYIAWWNSRIAERGARMLVVLVPDKMSVYGPSLGLAMPADPLLDRIQRDLESRGIPVVNGLTLLRATAEADLASGRLAYLREDQHWNATGVERIASATAELVRRLEFEQQGVRAPGLQTLSKPVNERSEIR